MKPAFLQTRIRGIAGVSPVPLLLMLLCQVCLVHNLAHADSSRKGVLDTPTSEPTTGSASEQSASTAELQEDMSQLESELKAEREQLKKMKRSELMKLAKRGERAAQMVLAEDFADEANQKSITIVSANDALSDAAYWYALAARRGFPGSPKIDGILPLFPMRSVRSPD